MQENQVIKNKNKLGKADFVKLVILSVFVILVFAPLISMLSNITLSNFKNVVSAPNFISIIRNSLVSTVIATIISVVLAYFLSLCTERINIKFKNFFALIFVIPMLIPSISHGMGLTILFGNNGILTNLFGLNSGIYGLKGIVIGSVLYSFPVAYLMLSDVMKYEDSLPYEAADILGIPKINQFMKITLPYLRKPIIAVLFSTFTMIITDYGVPLMVGGKYSTISVVMFQEVIGQLNFGKGAVYGLFLLIPAIVAFIADSLNKDKGNTNFVSKPFVRSNKLSQKILAYILCIITSAFVLVPVFSFIVLAFANKYPFDLSFTLNNFIKSINLKANIYLLNSIIIALSVALIGTAVAFMTAYLSTRMKSKISRFLHLSAITSAAIPGIVLGLSYVLAFKTSFIYGTMIILILVNIIHFISSPYMMIYNSLSKLNENLENVGQTLGISRLYMIKDIFLPSCKNTIMEMFSYFFVNSMMTISAVSFLATTANKPVALMISQFESQMQLECAAVVSLAILVVNLILKGIIGLIKYKNGKRGIINAQ